MSNTQNTANTTSTAATTIWPTFNYDDAPAAIDFLQNAFGFMESLVVHNETDDNVIEHAQLRWPEGGGIMLGSAGRPDNAFSQRPTGGASVYVVTTRPDEVYAQALKAGAQVFQALNEADHGSRGFSVTDPEGNIWSFGTYSGES